MYLVYVRCYVHYRSHSQHVLVHINGFKFFHARQVVLSGWLVTCQGSQHSPAQAEAQSR
jgi:hypothetical protein